MSNPDITIDELLEELRRCDSKSDDGMTTQELCDATGYSPKHMRDMLRKGIIEGRITTGKRRQESILRPGWTYVYNVFRTVKNE